MKNQAIQYLALDVHQATTVGTVRDESGSIRTARKVVRSGLRLAVWPPLNEAYTAGRQPARGRG